MHIKSILAACCAVVIIQPGAAPAGSPEDGFRWLSQNEYILREGVIWNDRFGDGRDRYKSGGLTQSWLIPERRLTDMQWFEGRASGVEIQARGFVATPDNTNGGGPPTDRPFVQFAGIGLYLRSLQRPVRLDHMTTQSVEDRIGVEFGYQGDPLPFFDIQESVHGNTAMNVNRNNSVGGEFLGNIEASRTWRIHYDFRSDDLEFAPFVQGSTGMRENSLRAGAELIYGTSLEGRTWNRDPAIGALIPGGSQPRTGANWALWIWGDVGYVASDAFLDGGFGRSGPSIAREEVTTRLRGGIMLEFEDIAIAYSVTWLSPEFEGQPSGQMIGAASLKYRF